MAADPIDERYDEIVRRLRVLPGAPEGLRTRVLDLGKTADVRRPRRRGLTLAVAAGLLFVAAVAGLILGSGGSQRQSVHGEAARAKSAGGGGVVRSSRATVTSAQFAPLTPKRPSLTDRAGSIALPVNPTRLTDVRASMRLRVSSLDGLSKATSKAMRITRGLGGFVQSVDYGTPSRGNGDAYLTVRIPVAHVQQAVVRFTALGSILSQHVSIRDLQDQSNAEELRILRLRKTAAQLRARLRGQLTPEERVQLQARLDAVRGLLRVKTQQHKGTLRQGRLSTFQLELTTRKGAAAVPSKPGRIERAARHAFSALSKTIAGLLYALIVLSPLLVLVAAALWAGRYRRRRVEQRLLARA
jgi:hypothetical protein